MNRVLSLVAIALFVSACSFDAEPEEVADTQSEIRGGSESLAFPEAVLINGPDCSGALIAPRIVLTAGHCAVPAKMFFHVHAPYAPGNKDAYGVNAAVLDYPLDDGGYVPGKKHDVGLLYLDNPINLPSYPQLSTWKLEAGSKVVAVGRVNDGKFSEDKLFRETITVRDGDRLGYPYSYDGENVYQGGDSGGPNFIVGTHVIASVTSAGGGISARVDKVTNWLTREVNAHGGFGVGGGWAREREVDKKKGVAVVGRRRSEWRLVESLLLGDGAQRNLGFVHVVSSTSTSPSTLDVHVPRPRPRPRP